ncbi:hypothetical protein TREMEDRAFT_25191, partial [Tremella mesenterica DSM 1558]|uniref:uncharacterized protein n=1 Tax=Tremella mesenterica (strain ATCC 24925 / CBS 8224 / DSM 1558 / NBRC 9311 / NRRL Y-6157 / RJB 2259-6 / UBC 559-6) TaxID=578456 RepID=UPI0003F49B1C
LTPLKIYLIIYNALSLLLWTYILIVITTFILTPRSSPISIPSRWLFPQSDLVDRLYAHFGGSCQYHNLGETVKWTQTLAVFDVLHAVLGLVRSSPGTALSQVASRLWAVWGVVELVPSVCCGNHPLYATMVLAWSVAEVLRYSFYTSSLFGYQIGLIDWLRYNAFYILYPVGASSEAFLSYSTLPPLSTFHLPSLFSSLSSLSTILVHLPTNIRTALISSSLGRAVLWRATKSILEDKMKMRWSWMEVLRLILFFLWWPSLYILMSHMSRQRRKHMSKNKLGKDKTL